ncbi:hypothetical protein SAMN05216327_109171 [Dyadobacter sp. SG02]|uniref:hypothetical protein n=1 Tax=Dyadobacter sp. SG02 TaxID=1855291 RepID=UPI0008CB0E20|nr:hypothetical protein [Dyadobacter sp. SG02]SEJ38583.1 hypothetical protein SAMN05216327_109171 [Dyadobacter sp. SG02]
MEDKIREKLAHLQDLAQKSVAPKTAKQRPAKPDSLSTVIHTKRDADLFMAQLDAVVKVAREEYLESKETK